MSRNTDANPRRKRKRPPVRPQSEYNSQVPAAARQPVTRPQSEYNSQVPAAARQPTPAPRPTPAAQRPEYASQVPTVAMRRPEYTSQVPTPRVTPATPPAPPGPHGVLPDRTPTALTTGTTDFTQGVTEPPSSDHDDSVFTTWDDTNNPDDLNRRQGRREVRARLRYGTDPAGYAWSINKLPDEAHEALADLVGARWLRRQQKRSPTRKEQRANRLARPDQAGYQVHLAYDKAMAEQSAGDPYAGMNLVEGGIARIIDEVGPVLGDIGTAISDSPVGELADALTPDANTLGGQIINAPIAATTGLVGTALTALDWAEEYVISRPISTIGQSVNIDNPLYDDGFQFSDITSMWNHSENITWDEALDRGIPLTPEQQKIASQNPQGMFQYGISPGQAIVGQMGTLIRNAFTETPLRNIILPDELETMTSEQMNSYLDQRLADPNGLPDEWWAQPALMFNSAGMYSEEQKERLRNSQLYNVMTGSVDVMTQILVGGKGVNAAASAARRGLGLATAVDGARQATRVGKQLREHNAWVESGGEVGRRTHAGWLLDKLVDADNAADVAANPLVGARVWGQSPAPLTDKLTNIITNTTDRHLIADIVSARMGDRAALGRLFETDIDVFDGMTEASYRIQAKVASGARLSDGDRAYLDAVHDSFINRSPHLTAMRDSFLHSDDAGTAARTLVRNTPMGVSGAPLIRSVAGRGQYALTKMKMDALMGGRRAMNELPITNPVNGRQTILMRMIHAPGRLGTTAVQWAAQKRALGMVSFDGLRPNDIAEEMLGFMRTARHTRGNRTFSYVEDGQEIVVNGRAFRQAFLDDLARAGENPKAQRDVVLKWERNVLSSYTQLYAAKGIPSSVVDDIIKDISQKRHADINDIKTRGGYYNEKGEKIEFDDAFLGQLRDDAVVLLPVRELHRALMRESGEIKRMLSNGYEAWEVANRFATKWWRTSVLVKPSYVWKNSLAEPWLASFLSHGSLVGPDGLVRMLGRVVYNTGQRAKQLGYAIADKTGISGMARLERQAAAERVANSDIATRERVRALIDQRTIIRAQLDSALAEREAIRKNHLSPAYREQWEQANLDEIDDLRTMIDDFNALLDDQDIRWRDLDDSTISFDDAKQFMSMIDEIAEDPVAFARRDRETLAALKKDKADPDIIEYFQGRIRLANMFAGRQPSGRFAKKAHAEERAQMIDEAFGPEGDIRTKINELEEALLDPSGGTDEIIAELQQALQRNNIDIGLVRRQNMGQGRATRELARRRANRERARQRKRTGMGGQTIHAGGTEYTYEGILEGLEGTEFGRVASMDMATRNAVDMGVYGAAQTSRWQRLANNIVIDPEDVRYFDELKWVTDEWVNDDLARVILSGADPIDVRRWLSRDEAGRAYARKMGWDDAEQRAELAARSVEMVHRYIPNPAVRRQILDGGVTKSDLEKGLAGHNLGPIHGGEWKYVSGNRVKDGINGVLDKLWKILATDIENTTFRFPWAQREMNTVMRKRIETAMGQNGGRPLTPTEVKALSVDAKREVINGLDNTFYNIRRYNGPVYATRYLMSFPGAYFNSMYRLGRMTYQKPGNALLASWFWQSGVYGNAEIPLLDENGEQVYDKNGLPKYQPIKDPTDARQRHDAVLRFNLNDVPDWLEELPGVGAALTGYREVNSPQTAIGLGSFDVGVQSPGTSWQISVPVTSFLMHKPMDESSLKDMLGEDVFRTMFPFGVPSNADEFTIGPVAAGTFVPNYMKDLYYAINTESEKFTTTATHSYQYLLAEWERGGREGPPPKPEDASKMARSFFMWNVARKWAAPPGTESRDQGSFYRDQWYAIYERNNFNHEKALKEFLTIHGGDPKDKDHWSRIYTIGTRERRGGINIPSTDAAYEIIDQHGDLLKDLVLLDRKDPRAAQILFASIGETERSPEFNTLVYDYLRNYQLPGDTESFSDALTPEQFREEVRQDEAWNKWNARKDRYEAKLAKNGWTGREIASEGVRAEYDKWKKEFERDPANASMIAEKGKLDLERANRSINALGMVLDNKKFMESDFGGTNFFKVAKVYVREVRKAQEVYDKIDDTDDRKAYARSWGKYMRKQIFPGSSEFRKWYDRNIGARDLSSYAWDEA